ncbi:putative non-specific serine/threonine protein kinase [Helianthus anomalus]
MSFESREVMKRVTKKVGKYEIGRTIGEGTFAKVKFAKNTETGEAVAVKVLAKSTILKHKMVDQVYWMLLFLFVSHSETYEEFNFRFMYLKL